MRQGPLAGRYPVVAAMVVSALVPYLVLSAALQPVAPISAKQLHMSAQAMSLTLGLANAGYAVGTVLAVQLALRLPQRRMLLVYGVLLVIGSVLAASATTAGAFIAGHILQGLCTSLLLIAALPPLIIGYPVDKARWTAIILNLCIFGAVALGPVVGGVQADAHAWRPLFWIVVGIAVVALVLSLVTSVDAPPADRSGPVDPLALGLAAGGCVAAFFGASELTTHRFLDPLTLGPLIGGLLLIVALLVAEYRGRCRLLQIRPLVSTLPTTGILVAMCAAAASVSAILLSGTVLPQRYGPLHVGLLYLPEFGGAVISALLFGAVFRRRALHYFVLTGMILLSAGIIVIGRIVPPTNALTLVGSGLIGIGVGSAVTPALYLVGFSVRSSGVQRVFAIVELLRAVAAFMIAPILLYVAQTVGSSLNAGTTAALWIAFGLSAGGALAGVCLYALGRVRPPTPAFERWLAGEGPAWDSPPLLAAVRGPSPKVELPEFVADADVRDRRLLRSLRATCGPPPTQQAPAAGAVSAGGTGQPG
jgi:MFS family permease